VRDRGAFFHGQLEPSGVTSRVVAVRRSEEREVVDAHTERAHDDVRGEMACGAPRQVETQHPAR
jgi:hypothetical protein